MITPQWSYLDFFAGGGMAGKGLGDQWRCLFANDIDPKKARSYEANFPGERFKVCDVADLTRPICRPSISPLQAFPASMSRKLAPALPSRDGAPLRSFRVLTFSQASPPAAGQK